jgi:hypothetical protein
MKRILSLVLLLAGVVFAQSVFAQDGNDKDKKKKKKAKSEQRSTPPPPPPAPGAGSDEITIDEGGQSKPNYDKKPAQGTNTPATDTTKTKSKNPQGAAKSGSGNNSAAPIAIDEGGDHQVREKNTATGAHSDSTATAPAVKPQD